MIFLTENIPYTPKMLADELDFEESTVQLALEALERLGMIFRDADGILTVTGWEEHQNIEGMDRIREQTRKRVAEHRSRKKQLELPDRYGNVTVTVCNATDKEEDIDKDKDKDNNTCSFCDAQKADFESFWKVYPKKVAKKEAFKAFKKIKTPVSVLIDAVEKQKKSDQWTRNHGQYIPYPTTWLNQERWIMEDDSTKTDQKFSGITYI